MDNQQLIKKSQYGGYQDIYPKTFIDAIRDKESGMSLSDILNGFNMYFLPYVGSPESTRLLVPKLLRRQGLWITYVKYDKTVVTEWYAGEDISDTAWKNSSNWRIGNNNLVGDITISSDGNWVVNGENTGVKAQGEPGITPLLQIQGNKLQVSYTNGTTWNTISDYIAAWFRMSATSASTAGDKICAIQISRDEGKTWSNLGESFTNSLHIKGYVSSVDSLPSSAANGDIYGVGPTYDASDSEHTNPIYNLYVKTSSGWVDNGRFTSISAGIVQELGDSETEVVSQKVVTEQFNNLETFTNIKSIKIVAIKNGLLTYTVNNNIVSISQDGFVAVYENFILRFSLKSQMEFSPLESTHCALFLDFTNIKESLKYKGVANIEIDETNLYVKNLDEDNNVVDLIPLVYWNEGKIIPSSSKLLDEYYNCNIIPTANGKNAFFWNRNSVTIRKTGFTVNINNTSYTISDNDGSDRVFTSISGSTRTFIVVDKFKVINGEKLATAVYTVSDTEYNYLNQIPIFYFYNKKPYPLFPYQMDDVIGIIDELNNIKAISIVDTNTLRINSTGFSICLNPGKLVNVRNFNEGDTPAYENGYKDFKGSSSEGRVFLTLDKNLLIDTMGNTQTIEILLSDLVIKDLYELGSSDIILCGWYYGKIETIGILSDAIQDWKLRNISFSDVISLNKDKESAILSCGFKRIRDVSGIKPLCFLHASDIHGGGISSNSAINAITDFTKVLNYYDNIQFGVVTGDVVYANFENSITWFNNVVKLSNKPVFTIAGNHDVGNSSKISECGTHEQVFEKMISPWIDKWEGAVITDKNYYYKDFLDEKVRFIFIYDYDDPLISSDGINYNYTRGYLYHSQEELDWLIELLKSTPDDYGVIIATHTAAGRIIGDNTFINLYDDATFNGTLFNNNEYPIGDIIDAFINKSNIIKTYTTKIGTTININADFSGKVTTEFICYINGHSHRDFIGKYEKFPNQTVLNIDCDNTFYTEPSDLSKKDGTKSSNVINVVGVDRNKRAISVVRVGADVSNNMQRRDFITIKY